MIIAASIDHEIADYLQSLVFVYIILVIAFVLGQMFFGFGGRMPYNRAFSAVLGFLQEVVGPFLAFFRRFIPMFGPLDLSPLVGILVLQLLRRLLQAY